MTPILVSPGDISRPSAQSHRPWAAATARKFALWRISLVVLLCVTPARADFVYTQTFTVNQPVADFGELVSAPVLSGLSGLITDVNVGLVLTPPSGDSVWSGDYYVSLGHDTAFSVLLNRIGKSTTDPYGSGHDGLNILLDQSAAAGDVHLAPYDPETPSALTGTWSPDGRTADPEDVTTDSPRTTSLDSFNGLSANGEWRLFIADDSPGGSTVLSSWSLHLTLAPDSNPLTVASGATLTASSTATLVNALINQGLVVAAEGQTLTFSGPVSGDGNFQGAFVFTGSYSLGNSPAVIDFTGDLTFEDGHVLTMEIGSSGYDILNVTGTLTLGGTLEVIFLNGFTPDPGDIFDFFTGGTITGAFDTILLPSGYSYSGNLAQGAPFSLLAAIPEPSASTALAALLILAVTACRRRRKE